MDDDRINQLVTGYVQDDQKELSMILITNRGFMHKNWDAFQTVWKFLGYSSTNKMPREVRKHWIIFTLKSMG